MRWQFSAARASLVGLILSASLLAPQPASSQGTTTFRDPLPVARLFPTLPMGKWVGQKVQFLAAPVPVSGENHGIYRDTVGWMRVKTAAEIEQETVRHGDVVEIHEVTPNASAPDYVKAMRQELDGKVATIISVETIQSESGTEKIVTAEVDRTKRRYTCVAYGNTIGNVVFLGELNAARRFFQGRTLYCQEPGLLAFQRQKIVRVPLPNFCPVAVQDVVPSTDEYNPLRFLLRTQDGKSVFADVHLGATNIPPSLMEFGDFATTFVVTDPRKVHHWTPAIWSAIVNRRPLVGMTVLQVTMALGKPYRIEGSPNRQAWTYLTLTTTDKVVFAHGVVHDVRSTPAVNYQAPSR